MNHTVRPKQVDSMNEILTRFGEQRSIPLQTDKSSEFTSLASLNLSPWNYSLDPAVSIKTEKDIDLDSRDFGFVGADVEQTGLDLPLTRYMDWYKMQHNATGYSNAVSYASMKIDSDAYEEQYLSLKFFLAGCSSAYKRELSYIMFPMFVHFYLDLVNKPDIVIAQSFYNKFQGDHDDNFKKELLRSLTQITLTAHLSLYNIVHSFRKQKYVVKLSTQVYIYLIEHLRHGNYTLVLQTLNIHFLLKSSTSMPCNSSLTFKHLTEKRHFTNIQKQNIAAFKNIAKNLNDTNQVLKPSICLFSFHNVCEALTCASFSSKSDMLSAGCEDTSILVWKLSTKNEFDEKALDVDQEQCLEPSPMNKDCFVLRGHCGHVYATSFMNQDTHILSASQDKSVILWDVSSKRGLVQFKGHTRSVWDVCASLHSSYFASCSLDRTVRLWNTECAYPLRSFAGHYESVDCVCFHPNGNYVASGSSDKSIRLWDLQSGQFVRLFVGHSAPVNRVAFTLDGKYMVSAGDDLNILIWDLVNSKILKKLTGHSKSISSLCFTCDNSMLASGGLDSYINVWESDSIFRKNDKLTNCNRIDSYQANSSSILSLSFSAGNLLLGACIPSDR